ncbi:MAG: hypothetical protein ACO4CI_11215, partial [Phycisphaerales bacterium]
AIPAIVKSREIDPATVVYLAIADGQGTVDRAPILQELWDRLRLAGIPINLVGKPADRSIAPAPPVLPTPSGP